MMMKFIDFSNWSSNTNSYEYKIMVIGILFSAKLYRYPRCVFLKQGVTSWIYVTIDRKQRMTNISQIKRAFDNRFRIVKKFVDCHTDKVNFSNIS